MLGGCLGLVSALLGLAMIGLLAWEYPPALLVLLVPFFFARRAWRKHLQWVASARADVEAAQGGNEHA